MIKAIRSAPMSKAICRETNFKPPPSQRPHELNDNVRVTAKPMLSTARYR